MKNLRKINAALAFLAALLLLANCTKNHHSTVEADQKTILEILMRQSDDWNKGDLSAFMKGYWENDSLMFIGSEGIVYGYQNTLERYQKNYDSPEKMGTLTFEVITLREISKDVYLMVGKFHLERTIGNAEGIFSLVWKKIKNQWVIVADHTG